MQKLRNERKLVLIEKERRGKKTDRERKVEKGHIERWITNER